MLGARSTQRLECASASPRSAASTRRPSARERSGSAASLDGDAELNDDRSRHGAAATPSSPVADSRLTLAYETGFLSGKTTGPGIVVPAARREADPFQPASRRDLLNMSRRNPFTRGMTHRTETYGQPRRTVMPKLFATRKRAPTKKRGSRRDHENSAGRCRRRTGSPRSTSSTEPRGHPRRRR